MTGESKKESVRSARQGTRRTIDAHQYADASLLGDKRQLGVIVMLLRMSLMLREGGLAHCTFVQVTAIVSTLPVVPGGSCGRRLSNLAHSRIAH